MDPYGYGSTYQQQRLEQRHLTNHQREHRDRSPDRYREDDRSSHRGRSYRDQYHSSPRSSWRSQISHEPPRFSYIPPAGLQYQPPVRESRPPVPLFPVKPLGQPPGPVLQQVRPVASVVPQPSLSTPKHIPDDQKSELSDNSDMELCLSDTEELTPKEVRKLKKRLKSSRARVERNHARMNEWKKKNEQARAEWKLSTRTDQARIAELEKLLKEKDTELFALRGQMGTQSQETDTRTSKMEQELSSRGEMITSFEKQLREHSWEINRQQTLLSEREIELRETKEQLKLTKNSLERCSEAHDHYKRQVESLKEQSKRHVERAEKAKDKVISNLQTKLDEQKEVNEKLAGMLSKHQALSEKLRKTVQLFSSTGSDEDFRASFEEKPSKIPDAGMGLFTTTFIPKGACLGEYYGEPAYRQEFADTDRYVVWKKDEKGSDEFMTQDTHVFWFADYYRKKDDSWAVKAVERGVDASRKGSHPELCPLRLMNHNEEGNVYFLKCDDYTPMFYALRDIEEGEEITWDYDPDNPNIVFGVSTIEDPQNHAKIVDGKVVMRKKRKSASKSRSPSDTPSPRGKDFIMK